MTLECFKAYDIRGRIGETLDEDIAWHIGRAYAEVLGAKTVIVGHDARASSQGLSDALAAGLGSAGARVRDIGLCGTEEVYFATGFTGADGGIMVTASHNPIDYNGMKLVGPGSTPIDPDGAFREIRDRASAAHAKGGETGQGPAPEPLDTRAEYAAHVVSMVDPARIKGVKVLLNAGNGTAGLACDAILEKLSSAGADLKAERLFWEPDPTFPNGIPNPLLPENRGASAEAVIASGADLGVAWDGDFDRCFFFDSNGVFIDGEYVVALVGRAMLETEPGAHIVHDPRVIWATTETVSGAGGTPVVSKTGHAFLKGAMRESGAIYGGEMSAHHYFREFYYCDSGMIPWLYVVEYMSRVGKSLAELVADLQARFPSSGEINFRVEDVPKTIDRVLDRFGADATDIDRLDGVSLTFPDWRMNIRASNTEPLLRLNLEARGNRGLLHARVAEVSALIEAC